MTQTDHNGYNLKIEKTLKNKKKELVVISFYSLSQQTLDAGALKNI